MLVYCPEITPRVEYTFNYLLKDLLGIHNTHFTSDLNFYQNSSEPKLAYSETYTEEGIYFCSSTLLFDSKIVPIQPDLFYFNGDIPAFFKTGNPKSSLPFDIFSAAFYFLSRYEEYTDPKRDSHGRFSAQQSLAFKHQFLKIPVVNVYAELLKKILLKTYPNLLINTPKFQFINSFDIDSIFAFKGKGIKRTLGGFTKDLMTLNLKQFLYRFHVITNNKKDPFDVFDDLLHLLEQQPIENIFFILTGKHSKYDKNISNKHSYFKEIVKKIAEKYTIGIHPSYLSNKNSVVLMDEIHTLKKIISKNIEHSRQHYLKLNLPETYSNLINAGIKHDYSMGYHDESGFRALCCTPFPFFDLKKNQITELTIHPFCFMDATFKYYKKTTVEEAISEIKALINTCNKYGGTCIAIWHNDLFSNYFPWEGWQELFNLTIENVKELLKS